MTFKILEELIIDKNVDKYAMKGIIMKNNDRREDEFVNVRCVKGKMKDKNILDVFYGNGDEKNQRNL
ncbi:73_t:CDS:2 [Dentiscutata erythropus]|uniref:73_t:CDS:1 n=1 Tax=Dentiscutata erythropus TaxID=1348616 RepID=A0A9N9IPE0_9GLOM|nr:73_t:CDS:2 [Dentiscutata erythropus]